MDREGGGLAEGGGGEKHWACSLLLSESGAGGLLSPAPQCLGQSPPAFNMGKTFTCLLLLLPMVRTSEVQLALKKGVHCQNLGIKNKKVENKNSKIFKVWEASAQVLVVQTVNLTECGELVQDLVSDAKDYDSRSVSVASHVKYCSS